MRRFWGPVDSESRFSRPGQSGALMPVRDLALSWVLLVLIAVLAWVITYQQARGMGVGPGTMGIGLLPFLLLWVIMMAAMMLPSMAPVAVTWAKGIGRQSSGWAKAFRLTQFIGGYLLAWTAFGLVAYGGLALTGYLVNRYPDSGRWVGAAAFLLAGLYQLGPLKYICLRHCRDPISQLLRYANFPRPARDLRVGLHHGAYCVGCCWALMVVLIPLGVMNIPAVAALAAVIFLEKLWRYGPYLAWVTGAVFLVLAVLAPFQDWLLPGLRMTGGGM